MKAAGRGAGRLASGLQVLRFLRLLLHVLEGVAMAALVLSWASPALHDRVIRRWSQRLLHILHIRLEVSGSAPDLGSAGFLLIANHVSWVDIFLLDAVRPLRFVSKSEVRRWPVIGWLAARAGTLFIARTSRFDTARINDEAVDALKRGDCVAFFPEGTTGDGLHLKPFHTSLLQAAVDAGALVWPAAIRYEDADGSPSLAVPFIGDMTITQSLARILGEREIRARIAFAPPLPSAGRNRRELAHEGEQIVSRLLSLPAPHRHAKATFP